MKNRLYLCLAMLLATAGPVAAADHAGHGNPAVDSPPAVPTDRDKAWLVTLARTPIAVTASFDEAGRLWLAKVENQYLYISYSDDKGRNFSMPVRVNREPEGILGDGENRPKIVARKGVVYVSYTQGLDKPMSGNIRFSRSLDGGKSFSMPVTVNDNREIISHRFETLEVNNRGQVYLAWLDKRDLSSAQREGRPYRGAAVYYAMSDDGGLSFLPNLKAADHSCECCRVAMALDGDGMPVIFWRHIYGKNERDHAMLRLDGKSEPIRVSYDRWEVDACPHHGGAISVGPDGTYHLVWFDNGPQRRGLFYAHTADQGKTFSVPVAFGNFEAQAGHPHVLAAGRDVYIVWKEFDGQQSVVRLMASKDGGKSWLAPRQLAATAGTSDHPLLIADGSRPYLSWYTLKEGLRLIEVVGE